MPAQSKMAATHRRHFVAITTTKFRFLLVPNVAGCRGINNSTLANVLPSCTETEHSQQEVLTLTQMSSPATTDTNATQHPDTTRPGNASKRADSAHKQPTGRLRQHAFTSAPLSAFLRRITRLTTERELRTPRVPAIQQQSQPASQLEARARSRDSCLRHALWCSFPQPQNQSTTTIPYVNSRGVNTNGARPSHNEFIHCSAGFNNSSLQPGTPLLTCCKFNPAWINSYIHYDVRGENTYP